MATSTDFTPAQRGWIAVTSRVSRHYSLITGSMTTLSITVGTVESVARDGTVKKLKPASDTAAVMSPRDWHEIVVLDPARLADPAGFLAECKARQTPAPDTYRPFESMNDVRETARKYRV